MTASSTAVATVLVVDDKQVNRELVRTLLDSRGHMCIEADDGLAALKLFRQERPDLVITDVLMPSMDGYEMVREIRAGEIGTVSAAVPVIFYTANYLESEARPIAAALGVSSVVPKSGDVMALLDAIDAALAQPMLPTGPVVDEDFSREHLRVLNAKLVEKIEQLEDQERLRRLIATAVSMSGDLSTPDTLQRLVAGARSVVRAQAATLRRSDGSRDGLLIASSGDVHAVGEAVSVPIMVRGERFGVLSVVSPEARGEDDTSSVEDTLADLASAAGQAIANAQAYDDARRRQAWLTASTEITSALLAAEPTDALELVVRGAREVAGTSAAWIAEEGADGEMRCYVSQRDGTELADARPLLTIPLHGVQDSSAALVLAGTRGEGPLGPVDIEMATTFAGHASLALQFAAAADDRRRLGILEERDRIATDLHDVVIQRLFALGLRLSSVRTLLPLELVDRVESMVNEIDETIDDIRNSIFLLRADAGSFTTLRRELLRLAEQATPALGFRPVMRISGPLDTMVPGDVGADVLATVREALSNVARHAGASEVQVVLIAADSLLTLRVSDDGCGLPAERWESGLANLRRRAEQHGGAMQLSAPRQGTGLIIDWTVPLSGEFVSAH